MRSRWLLAPVLLSAVLPGSPASAARPGLTEQASLSSHGVRANRSANLASISRSGRVVAFMTSATNLATGDLNGFLDIYARDRGAGITERVSEAHDGGDPNGLSITPVVSSDGRFVAYRSGASNLVPSDANGAMGDVFVRDTETGSTELVSVSSQGAAATLPVAEPAISGDGRLVAFTGSPANLVPGDTNGTTDVFLRDRAAGETTRVSLADDESQATGGSSDPVLSEDGRFVAFHSTAANLVAGDDNAQTDVFVRDLAQGRTLRVSIAADGRQGDGHSSDASVSADGRYVAFRSSATNMVPGDANAVADVFVRDLVTATTERVSVRSDGAEAAGASERATISSDGRYVAFRSAAENLVPGDINGKTDVFVHDRLAGTTELISAGTGGGPANDLSDLPSISGDGSLIAFESTAGNLVPGINLETGIYVRDTGPALGLLRLPSAVAVEGGVEISGEATVSGVVASAATDPSADAAPGAGALGAELTGASIVHRPELGDVMVRIDTSALPAAPAGSAGANGLVYGLDFLANGQRFEARLVRASVSTEPPGVVSPAAVLYRCSDSCEEMGRLAAAIGTTGNRVTMSIPVSSLGSAPLAITEPRAFAAVGHVATGGLEDLDDVTLPAASVSVPHVELALTPEGSPDVEFGSRTTLPDGRFAGIVDGPAATPGSRRAWARVCLASTCSGTGSVRV